MLVYSITNKEAVILQVNIFQKEGESLLNKFKDNKRFGFLQPFLGGQNICYLFCLGKIVERRENGLIEEQNSSNFSKLKAGSHSSSPFSLKDILEYSHKQS